MPFTITTNNTKYLGVTITKQVKDLYDNNFKPLKEEIGEEIERWKDFPCSWASRNNIVKMLTLPKVIYRLNTIPIKIPTQLFTNLERTIFDFIWQNKKKPKVGKIILYNKELQRYHHSWFQARLRSHSNKNHVVLA